MPKINDVSIQETTEDVPFEKVDKIPSIDYSHNKKKQVECQMVKLLDTMEVGCVIKIPIKKMEVEKGYHSLTCAKYKVWAQNAIKTIQQSAPKNFRIVQRQLEVYVERLRDPPLPKDGTKVIFKKQEVEQDA